MRRTARVVKAWTAAGVLGFAGNWIATVIRRRAGHRLESAPLVADGAQARADTYVSLAAVASAAVVARAWSSRIRLS